MLTRHAGCFLSVPAALLVVSARGCAGSICAVCSLHAACLQTFLASWQEQRGIVIVIII